MTRISIRNGRVMTMDPTRRVLEPGLVIVEDEHLAYVGPAAGYDDSQVDEVIDATGMAVLPGFVNTHTHVPQILLRGGASHDRGLFDWLWNVLHPGLAAYTPEDVGVATRLYCAEALRSGITTVVDNEDISPDDFTKVGSAGIAAFVETGMRAIYARMYFDAAPSVMGDIVDNVRAKSPSVESTDMMASTDHILDDLDALIRAHHGTGDGRIQIWPAPAIPYAVSEKGLRAGQQLAAERGTGWTMHVSEDRAESRVHWMTSPKYLHNLGCLDSRLLAAHCVHIDDRDIRLFQQAGTKVSTQPVSNSYLGAGVAPVPAMVSAGVSVGLGSDDANCNDSVNLISDMKVLALVHRAVHEDAAILTPEKILEMATIDGARCIGMEDRIGSLEAGKLADVICVDLAHPQMTPAHDIASTIVFQAYGNEVDTVLVNGRVVMRARRLAFLPGPEDEPELLADAAERASAILERSHIVGCRPWTSIGA